MSEKITDWTKEELISEYVNKYTPLTIPVNISVRGRQTILSFSVAEKVLKDARIIAIEECACRSRLRRCDAPRDVCLSIDDAAMSALERGAKRLSKARALGVLKRSHEAGLVHVTYTIKDQKKPRYICSCCSCCCHSLGALIRFGIPDHVVASEYLAADNRRTCNHCGTCVKRCQFRARQLREGKLEFDQMKCFGCGLCVTKCPTTSIALVRRSKASDLLREAHAAVSSSPANEP